MRSKDINRLDLGDGGRGAMAVKDDPPICKFCKVGHVFKRMEEIAFYQSSDKGYVHCRATIIMGVCDNCQSRVVDREADKIFDDAFQREYKKLP